jgi:hypothetical protein
VQHWNACTAIAALNMAPPVSGVILQFAANYGRGQVQMDKLHLSTHAVAACRYRKLLSPDELKATTKCSNNKQIVWLSVWLQFGSGLWARIFTTVAAMNGT